jgi:hypothetical protein
MNFPQIFSPFLVIRRKTAAIMSAKIKKTSPHTSNWKLVKTRMKTAKRARNIWFIDNKLKSFYIF